MTPGHIALYEVAYIIGLCIGWIGAQHLTEKHKLYLILFIVALYTLV